MRWGPMNTVAEKPGIVALAITKIGQVTCGCRRDDKRLIVVRRRGYMFMQCPDCGRQTQGFKAHEPTEEA